MARRTCARTWATVSWLLPSTTASRCATGSQASAATAELRQVGIAALHVVEVDASAGAEQLQREIRRGMLKGNHGHRHIRSRGRYYLQRQGRFAHAKGDPPAGTAPR